MTTRSFHWKYFLPLLILTFLILFVVYGIQEKKPNLQKNCDVEEKQAQSDDPLLKGAIEPGSKVKILLGWYNCHPIQKGDFVLYRYSSHADPIIRIVRAVEGDRFNLVPDQIHGAWNLSVNGQIIMAENGPYFFGANTPPTLSLYQEARKDGLNSGELILLSNLPPGDLDSGILGVLKNQDVLGKIELIQ